RFSIFEKLRARATSSQFQTPSSKEAPGSKLKNRPARRLPRHLILGFGVLRFGTSLELGVWCWVFAQRRFKNCDVLSRPLVLVIDLSFTSTRLDWNRPGNHVLRTY